MIYHAPTTDMVASIEVKVNLYEPQAMIFSEVEI